MSLPEIILSIFIVFISAFLCACVMGTKVKKQSELASSPATQNRRHSIWSAADIWLRWAVIISMAGLPVLVLLCIKCYI